MLEPPLATGRSVLAAVVILKLEMFGSGGYLDSKKWLENKSSHSSFCVA